MPTATQPSAKIQKAIETILAGVSGEHWEGGREALESAWKTGLAVIVPGVDSEVKYHAQWKQRGLTWLGVLLVVSEEARAIAE